MNARDLMTSDPVTVSAHASVAEAAEILREMDIRHLPVVDSGALVGILSDRDLRHVDDRSLERVDEPGAIDARRSVPVARVMTTEVIAVDPEADVSEIIAILIETKIGAVPVVEQHTRRLVGIVSYIDVLRAVQDLVED